MLLQDLYENKLENNILSEKRTMLAKMIFEHDTESIYI